METQNNNIQSISIILQGLDTAPIEMHLDKITKRKNGEYLYYDEKNNVMLVNSNDGTLQIQLVLTKANKK